MAQNETEGEVNGHIQYLYSKMMELRPEMREGNMDATEDWLDIADALLDPEIVGGRFDVELDSSALPYRIVGAMISLRSRLSRVGTGDQAIRSNPLRLSKMMLLNCCFD